MIAVGNRKIKKKIKWTQQIPFFLMIIPGVVYLIINNYIPMFGVFIAFKNIDFGRGIFASEWVGLDNFKYLFKTDAAFIMTRNTVLYNLAFIIVGTVTGVAVGIMLSEITRKILSKFYQTVILLPFLFSSVIIAYIGYAFMSTDTGLLNNSILPFFGIDPVSWYSEPIYWPFIILFVNTWKGIGYSAVLYLSVIIGIDKAYYEAAKIDGATKWKEIRYITLPMLKPMIIILVILSIGRIFNSDFGLFYMLPMNAGSLYSTTQTIDTYVYRGLMELNDISMSAAAGLYQSVVGFIMVIVANATVKKVSKENALF